MSNSCPFSLSDLEKLSRIELKENEKKHFEEKLKNILHAVEQLNEVDTKDVPPCTYVNEMFRETVFRKDETGDLLSNKEFLSNAPEHVGGLVRVPPVIPS